MFAFLSPCRSWTILEVGPHLYLGLGPFKPSTNKTVSRSISVSPSSDLCVKMRSAVWCLHTVIHINPVLIPVNPAHLIPTLSDSKTSESTFPRSEHRVPSVTGTGRVHWPAARPYVFHMPQINKSVSVRREPAALSKRWHLFCSILPVVLKLKFYSICAPITIFSVWCLINRRLALPFALRLCWGSYRREQSMHDKCLSTGNQTIIRKTQRLFSCFFHSDPFLTAFYVKSGQW